MIELSGPVNCEECGRFMRKTMHYGTFGEWIRTIWHCTSCHSWPRPEDFQ
jgi:hypothetical protein